MENNTKTDLFAAALDELAEVIATEIVKRSNSVIEKSIEKAVNKYIDGSDFTYMLEDAVREKIESHVEDYVSGISLSVRID
jgi:hypothetical protein